MKVQQVRGGLPNQGGQFSIESGDLLTQRLMALREGFQRRQHEAFLGVGVNTGPTGSQGLDQTDGSERAVLLAQSHGRGDQLLTDLDLRCGAGLDR